MANVSNWGTRVDPERKRPLPEIEARMRSSALDVAAHKGLVEPRIVHFVPLGDRSYLITLEGRDGQRDWLVAV